MEEASTLVTICNLLSLTVLLLCVVMKVPQIWSAFKQGDTKGISLSSVLLEQCGYSIILSYSFAMNYPAANYLETAFLVLQNFVMLAFIALTRNLLTPTVVLIFVLYMIGCMTIAFKFVPEFVVMSIMSFCTPLSVSSKLTQLADLYKRKEPGRLSMLTWGIAAYSCYVRIFTNLVQTVDTLIIIHFTCGAALNTLIVSMIHYYARQNKPKVD